jgi:hypothetical protein
MNVQILARHFRLSILLVLLLGGCSTSYRSAIGLSVPTPGTYVIGKKEVVIDRVADQREFLVDSKDRSRPSVAMTTKGAPEGSERKALIARRKGGFYNLEHVYVQLERPQTVETLLRKLVTTGLEERGYRVVDASAAAPEALRVTVGIKEFWAWPTPRFWVVDTEAKIRTSIEFTGPVKRTIEIAAYGKKEVPLVSDEAFKQALDSALKDYVEKQRVAFAQAGL